jgi:hypothetical protein
VPPIREQYIQRAVFDHIRWRRMPGVFAFRVPNAGKRNSVEAGILKGLSTRAGLPDVFAVHQGRCYAIELKTESGRFSRLQRNAIAASERAGALTAVCRGLDAALNIMSHEGFCEELADGGPKLKLRTNSVFVLIGCKWT